MDFINNFNVNRFLFSLQYMWKGMLCIFIVIGVIVLFTYALNKITGAVAERKKRKAEAKAAAESADIGN